MMSNEMNINPKEYFSKLLLDFDESTLISPNKNGEKEKESIVNSEYKIKKEYLAEFLKSNSITINELFLAGLVLTLNKFNFSHETVIFNDNNVPLATKFENRQISIKEFLNRIHEEYTRILEFDGYLDEDYLLLEPEFHFIFNGNLKTEDIHCSNYLNILENDETVCLSLFYNNELYTKDYIDLFLSSIEKIINQIIDVDINKTNICDIAIESEKEDIHFGEVELPFIHKRFEKQVELHPNKTALIATDATLTYNQLNRKSNRIANALIKKGLKAKNKVVIKLQRDSNLISAIMGVLKAGCTFIPIDMEYPKGRIDYIIENSQADYLITNDGIDNSINVKELLWEDDDSNPNVDISPDDLAYMIYTSGSTGNPKGVMISHKNITNLFTENEDNLIYNNYSKIDRILTLSTVSFDAFLLDFMPLTIGLEVIFAGDSESKTIVELVDLSKRTKPDAISFATPSRLLHHLQHDMFKELMYSIKYVAIGGELSPPGLFEQLLEYPDLETFNVYGPTETTVICNANKITDANNVTVGKALYNCITDVRDIDGKLLPHGVIGELYIGGYGVSRGYYNLEEKTKEVFLTINDIPYYKSGDYALELPNGELVIKGRIDNQIKLRGLRIEIGEIESSINEYPNIKECVVVIKELNNNNHLCAYFIADEKIDENDLRDFLKERLTNYMVPTVLMQLDEMPETPNGKIDVKALPEPILKLENVVPEGELEEKLFKLASEIVNTTEFGVTDDLYAIGFSSLSLMKLDALMYENFSINIDIFEILNNPTIRDIKKLLIAYRDSSNKLDKIIESSKDTVYYPLTSNQLGIYFECIQNQDIAQYNLPAVVRFDSAVDANRLKEAIIKTINAYPYLKTRIVMNESKLVQKRDDSIAIDEIPIVEIDNISNDEIQKENVKRFRLDNDQLFRAKIYKTPVETILFFDMHHIISDGESLDHLFNNFAYAYEGKEIDKEIIDGYVYSLIEKEMENSEEYNLSKEYFNELLTQDVESTILTPDLNGDPDIGELKSIYKNVDLNLVKEFCSDKKISPNVLFMACTVLTLNKYTFSDKTLLTTIFNGRTNPDYFNTQAFLVKTLPIVSINENRDISVRQLLNQISEVWKNGIKHSDYPYTKISEEFQLKPEFMYTYNNLDAEKIEINNKVYRVSYLDTIETTYKITLDVNETIDNLELHILYNDQLYSDEYINTFLNSILSTLEQFMDKDIDKLKIKEIELNNNYEIPTFTEVETPFIHKRFERQVEENPENIALVSCDGELTYAELNEKANRIANGLINRGVKAGGNVLIMLHRDSNLIASILGILKAGCAYIPIDLEYPQDRINYIFENSQADYIISDGNVENAIDVYELLEEEDISNPDVEISPDDLAYMIYTSGSTGNPKGVMISHENICNQAQNQKSDYESLLSIATVSFDVSVDDILTSLSNGMKLILANDSQIKNILELVDLIEKNNPEVCELTPSRLGSYLELEEFCNIISCFKAIFLGGEQFSTNVFETLRKYSDAIVYNSYGPTETTITSNNNEITDIDHTGVGRPLHNYVCDVRDIDGKLLPYGVIGELFIGGVGVGKGYYNMPDKTKEVFLTINDIPYYRSGDYAVSTPDGEIEIKGRIDNQIKLRGLRIEIGEIEKNISKYPDIKQVVVVIREIYNNEHLCAYFTADGKIDTVDLKNFLTQHLTRYMVPTVFMQLEEMPQTPNGKTDIKQLPEPKLELTYVAPENPLEQLICTLFSVIIGIDSVGAEDNFFEIGGTSLIASKLILELIKRGYAIKYQDVFNNQTPRQLAEFLSRDNNAKESDFYTNESYDYTDINNLLSENTLENFRIGEKQEIGNMLLLGATGYLGIHVLYDFIKNEDGIAYCMLRKGEFDSCEDRLINLMNYYFNEDLSDLIGTRIVLCEGDITSFDDFKKLKGYPIHTLINCAAIVKHYTADKHIFNVNVDGVINGINFARSIRAKFIQISTLSVLSPPIDGTLDYDRDERTLYYGQDLSNKYVASKFLAERKLLEAAVNGLDVKIIRVGNLMGRYSDGMFQKNYDTNAFLSNIKSIKNIQTISQSMYDSMVEMSPIDCTAKAIIALSKTPKKCRVFNCQNDNFLFNKDIVEVLNSFGYGIEKVSDEEFVDICMNNLDENIQGLITSDVSLGDSNELIEDYEINVNMNQTVEILHSIGFYWPKPDPDYLRLFISYLRNLDFFD